MQEQISEIQPPTAVEQAKARLDKVREYYNTGTLIRGEDYGISAKDELLKDVTDQDLNRFFSKMTMREVDECWPWIGGGDRHGYGRIAFGGRQGKEFFAHRVSYFLFYKSLPDGACICHTCDNPQCINPHHLYAGTQADNIRDIHARKRRSYSTNAHGERVGTSKLKSNQVMEIISLYRAGGNTQRALAKRFGVAQGTIWQIVSGGYWKHLKQELS